MRSSGTWQAQQHQQFRRHASMWKVPGVAIFAFTCLVCLFVSYFVIRDAVSCQITGAGLAEANGYYSALNGVYIKRGGQSAPWWWWWQLDVYQIYAAHSDVSSAMTITFRHEAWTIALGKEAVYINRPSDKDSIYHPPASGWQVVSDISSSTSSTLTTDCVGSLSDSPTTTAVSKLDNFGTLMATPVTTALLAIIFWYAYHLWTERIDPGEVATSYDLTVTQHQYWRAITASFAHYEPFHLLFNTMSLYNLGFIEGVYGSLVFGYLSADLVIITIAICLLMDHTLIHYRNMPNAAFSRGVGYSCVLFAWMVAASVRLKQYCPIFLFPDFCFPTFVIPFVHLPVNFGPVILLFVTKLVIPSSSFMGHLAGILIGYPLAWNWLDFLTPPLFTAGCVMLYLYLREKLMLSRLSGFEQSNGNSSSASPLETFVSVEALGRVRSLRLLFNLYALSTVAAVVVYGPWAFPRFVLAWLLYAVVASRRCMFVSDQASLVDDCSNYLVLTLILGCVLAVSDFGTVGAVGCGWSLVASSTRSFPGVLAGFALTLAFALLEWLVLWACVRAAHELSPQSYVYNMCGQLGLTAANLNATSFNVWGGGSHCAALCSRNFGFLFGAGHQYSPVPTSLDASTSGAFAGRGNRLDGGGSSSIGLTNVGNGKAGKGEKGAPTTIV